MNCLAATKTYLQSRHIYNGLISYAGRKILTTEKHEEKGHSPNNSQKNIWPFWDDYKLESLLGWEKVNEIYSYLHPYPKKSDLEKLMETTKSLAIKILQ